MAYRGEDLDLRTPQTWNLPPADQPASAGSDPYLNGGRTRSASYGRSPQPILVDDVVLACCNHAFDVAVAHRASEVRLEHLLHAMTRIDGASNALEARGIRVSGLRRESATVIAGEIPIGVGAGQSRPRRSEDLEALLRAASSIAYRRNGPANIDDVLDALLDMPADLPGIALLARHGGRIARDRIRQRQPQRELVRERDQLPLPPLPPLSRTSSGYNDLSDPLRDRAPVASSSYLGTDLSRPLRSDLVGTPTDGIQNARLDQIETAVRTLTGELASERNVLSGVVQDLQRNIKADRGGLQDRLQSLEQTVLDNRNGPGDANMLLDRLAAVERGLEQRLNDLSRPWSVLSDRLQGLEQTILDSRSQGSPDIGGVHDRIAGLERAYRENTGEAARATSTVADRLKMLERSLDAVAAKSIDLGPINHRLDIIEEAVLSHDGNQGGDKIAEKLKALDDSMAAQRATTLQAAQSLNNDVKALASALTTQAANTERTHALVTDRMQTLISGFDRQRTEFAGLLDTRAQSEFTPLMERITAMEQRLADSIRMTNETQAAHTAELKEVHEALIKLNTNQHTLAGSIDQWRLDGVGDITVIAKQLEGLEKSTSKPLQMMEALTTSVDNINKVTVERYHRRHRFWYWLFGTDDWLTASWPSQVASVEAERVRLKGAAPKVAASTTVATPAAPATKPAQR